MTVRDSRDGAVANSKVITFFTGLRPRSFSTRTRTMCVSCASCPPTPSHVMRVMPTHLVIVIGLGAVHPLHLLLLG